ncbi:SNF2 family domain-containing protein [Coniochaeta sp. 2T2.1]|nr:SNF2 family domain-containing protein [Coniochaeta sp. 2T2.1]
MRHRHHKSARDFVMARLRSLVWYSPVGCLFLAHSVTMLFSCCDGTSVLPLDLLLKQVFTLSLTNFFFKFGRVNRHQFKMAFPLDSVLNPENLDNYYLRPFEDPSHFTLSHGQDGLDGPTYDGDYGEMDGEQGSSSPSDSLFVTDVESQARTPRSHLLSVYPQLRHQQSSSASSVSGWGDTSMTDFADGASEITPEEIDMDSVCYGMVHKVDVKLQGQASQLLPRLSPAEGPGANHMQKFTLEAKSDHILLSFQDGAQFGYLRDNMTEALRPLLTSDDLSFEAVASTATLRARIAKVEKQGDTIVHVDINIYGPRARAKTVGEELSSKKVWLQKPDYFKRQYSYENPHLIRFPDVEDAMTEQIVQDVQVPEPAAPQPTVNTVQQVVNEVHRALHRAEDLDREDGDERLRTELMDALTIRRFIHCITKQRSTVRPDEKGGGVLADEMGMGKSLAILALIIRTLDRAREWADNHRSDEQSHSGSYTYSHSTLVIVPSALLINSWESEIKRHLGEALTVRRYHGQGRERKVDVLAASDVVLTTYNTLAADTAKRKSPLHNISWYRVVLDEANSRWCLTGTPIQNRLEDIGSLFAFLKVEPWNNRNHFRKHIAAPFENKDTVVIERLVMLYDSLVLRRTKEILTLPGQDVRTRELELSPEEREQYSRTTNILNRRIRQLPGGDEAEDKFGLFQAQLQLRILCNHGTWQKLFSWKKRDLMEEQELSLGEAGLDAEATCAGCKQPRPILGSNRIHHQFVERCSHMLCAECLEDCGGENITHCPLCRRFKRTADSAVEPESPRVEDDSDEEDTPMADVEEDQNSGKPKRRDDAYFNFHGHSTKMEALVSDVKQDLHTTKSIIFSCWTRTLDLVEIYLHRNQIPFLRIDGEILLSKRQKILNEFAEPDSRERVMLMTTGTGAFGLNLTAANRIFIVELQWNPTVENQAIARAIRINQSDKVLVTRYKMKGTVEQEIESQQFKKKMAAQAGFVRDDEDMMEHDGGHLNTISDH